MVCGRAHGTSRAAAGGVARAPGRARSPPPSSRGPAAPAPRRDRGHGPAGPAPTGGLGSGPARAHAADPAREDERHGRRGRRGAPTPGAGARLAGGVDLHHRRRPPAAARGERLRLAGPRRPARAARPRRAPRHRPGPRRTPAPRSSCGCLASTPPGSGRPWMPGQPPSSCRRSTASPDAVAAARASRYPPRGERSWGPFPPLWGGAAPDPATANATVRCIVMVETRRCPRRRRRHRGDAGRRRAVRRALRPLARARHDGRRRCSTTTGPATRSARSSRQPGGTASSSPPSPAPRRTRTGCGRTASGAWP